MSEKQEQPEKKTTEHKHKYRHHHFGHTSYVPGSHSARHSLAFPMHHYDHHDHHNHTFTLPPPPMPKFEYCGM